ncbi:ABC transporter substrate-binding protein [Pareuzebyella sediminis]|uniref:ABC transporter substrate-binding protein n=1 Tax=Pareuzebyella sediminis TaxID=2607998 RepID=UPI0011F08AD4|nr:ABC transporter substrate-binding protein [Pareuzebyella sediminis]
MYILLGKGFSHRAVKYGIGIFLILSTACKQNHDKATHPDVAKTTPYDISYAQGFSIEKSASGVSIVHLKSPWPNADTSFSYALVPREKLATITLNKDAYDAIIPVPVKSIVATSTTHIPALEALGVSDKLVGFPNTDFISSKTTRQRIDKGLVAELGNNETINSEIVLELHPELFVGFGINDENRAYKTIKKAKIPVVYNGDWIEESPLGKAEWIKFFAVFFGKEKEADSIFKNIALSYQKVKNLAVRAKEKPSVLTGGLYKDVWHVAGGKSWMAEFIKDAKGDYLWSASEKTGGIALSMESVLDKAKTADYWLNPSMLTSYEDMIAANRHYTQFEAYKKQHVYTNTLAKGPTGGLMFYEQAPQRPDLVLRDLVHIFHNELLPDHRLIFFKPLK